jgi:hypothetical protein
MPSRRQPRAVIGRASGALLMPAGAFAVHQLRYWLAFHGVAGVELQRQGHAYLHSVVPWIVLSLALAAGAFVRSVGRALGGECSVSRYATSFAAMWLLCAGCLVGIYVCQEFLEGVFLTGHPAGVAGIFGYGGWWSVPAAACIGLVLAALFHGARWVLRAVAERGGRRAALPRAPLTAPLGGCRPPAPRLTPVVVGWSDRGPPR